VALKVSQWNSRREKLPCPIDSNSLDGIVALGGWIVVFMTHVRGASSIAGGAAASGFWGGMTVGRLFLSFVTVRLGEFWAMMLYLGLTVVFELVFWLAPNMIASAVAVALIGVVMGKSYLFPSLICTYSVTNKISGPMFPTAVVLITKVLPRSLHVGTIGFATAFGGSGGAILPFAVGAIAQAKGVKVLQPIVLGICVALAFLWLLVPRGPPGAKKSDRAETSSNATTLDA
jgi:fucose permease